jgi:hypothetical protein
MVSLCDNITPELEVITVNTYHNPRAIDWPVRYLVCQSNDALCGLLPSGDSQQNGPGATQGHGGGAV